MGKACTTILVGKKASIDGSIMVARNDDTFEPYNPQHFIVRPAYENEDKEFVSTQNGFKAKMPKNALRTVAIPNVDVQKLGDYDEAGINSANVAMSATESVYANSRVLSLDPLVKDGMAEDSMQTMVAQFIKTAREGVERTGQLIAEYGSPEGNGVIFADENEIWYMEIVTGHHWVAIRIPDNAYAVTANQVAIERIDFHDPANFMWSDGIREFVDDNGLNPDKEGWNFRHIFGTSNQKDRHYNTPRVWYIEKWLNNDLDLGPESSELPFVNVIDHQIDITDIQYLLGSHYQETEFDPLGNGSKADKTRYRPIGLNRTQNSHILQIRPDQSDSLKSIMWLCVGGPAFAPYIPFYTNITETPESFRNTPLEFNTLDSAYWLYHTLSFVTESYYDKYRQTNIDYLTYGQELQFRHLRETDDKASQMSGADITNFLTKQNEQNANVMASRTKKLLAEMITIGLSFSKLTFTMDKNL